MRLTCNLCVIILIFLGLCGGILAFSGFDLLLFLCFFNVTVKRMALAVGFVAALFCIYALVYFKPFKGLK